MSEKHCEDCIWGCQCDNDFTCEDFYRNDEEQILKEYLLDLHIRYEEYIEIINEFN